MPGNIYIQVETVLVTPGQEAVILQTKVDLWTDPVPLAGGVKRAGPGQGGLGRPEPAGATVSAMGRGALAPVLADWRLGVRDPSERVPLDPLLEPGVHVDLPLANDGPGHGVDQDTVGAKGLPALTGRLVPARSSWRNQVVLCRVAELNTK